MTGLTLSYRQMAGLLDFLSAGMVLLSPDRQILHLNRTAEMLTDWPADEAVGRRCGDILGGYLCDGDCLFERAVASASPALTKSLSPPADGREADSLTKIVSPVYGADGHAVACLEIFQDVSAFSELIDRLGDESRKMREILDLLDIGVITCDRGGHVTFFNAMAEAVTGLRRQDLLGKPCRGMFNEDFCPKPSRAGPQNGEPDAREVQLVTREGRRIPVKAKYLPLRTSGGGPAGMLTTFTDLSLVYQYRNAIEDRSTFFNMISSDPKMQRIVDMMPAIAGTDTTVLIEGPTGAGKDLLAKVIHTISPRAEKPLVKVNCAALPDNLLESEMFGYAKGAFTGADRDKPGRFQDADGGTLFLDEIGDLPLALQAKLLRVLEDREFYPLGSRKPCRVDVRIVSATNRDLKTLVAEKRFREDLYYRLNVMRIELPPLRERPSDLPLLIDHILKKLCALKNVTVNTITEAAMAVLLNHDYPGNIRELENILEHALIVSRGSVIDLCHLPVSLQHPEPPPAAPPSPPPPSMPSKAERTQRERRRILAALEAHEGHRGLTAASLGMDRSTLWRKMKRLGIQA